MMTLMAMMRSMKKGLATPQLEWICYRRLLMTCRPYLKEK